MGSNPRSQPQELDHIVGLADPKLILTTRDALPVVSEVAAGRGIHPAQVCLVDERAVDYCAQRYRSFDPATGTYLGFDGQRHPCP